ncbi:MAG: hypothetical protein O7H39_00420 [Gammaproteobacteria bacterium]|nr:hypothetical protein [Gammaproteobacteria bacterium]
MPVRIPVIEMVEIGAGGGSLAKVDKLGRIQVGPESAGSEPGPACYGRGGTQPTVSDADVVMGRLDAGHFAGGTMQLDERAARTAVVEHVANTLDFDAVTGAFGITEVVDENMSAAARAHAVEWGKDAAGRAMVAYGGAAPLHAARIAEKLDIDHIIVPKGAGVGSAVGFLIAPVSYEVVRSRYMRLSSFDAELVNVTMREMFEEADAVVAQAASGRELTESRRAYMRYVGQGYEIAVGIPAREITAADAALVAEAFDVTYRSLYGRVIPGLDVEVLSWTLTLATSAAAVQRVEDCESQEAPPPRSTKSMYDPRTAAMLESALYLREDLQPGNRIEGPALIIEAQTTTVVASGYYVEVNAREDLVMKRAPKQ